MKRQSEQLSLPLFELDRGDAQTPPAVRSAPPVRGRVASGRPLSQPPEASREPTADAAAPGPTLLTTREAADRLRVHPRTVQRLVERGELSAVHLGTAVRFDPADLSGLTERLKHRASTLAHSCSDSVRPTRAARLSFAERLRSRNDEHRAAET